jgi:hypothetical protein
MYCPSWFGISKGRLPRARLLPSCLSVPPSEMLRPLQSRVTFSALPCAWAVWVLALGSTSPAEVTGFHIGNSLTWSAVSPGLPSVVEALGGSLSVGYHIRCGAPLENIVAEPGVTCVAPPSPYGNWHNALTQHEWDYITFQTHAGMAATEIQAARDLVATATAGGRNAATRFFVYSAWPTRSAMQTYREARTQSLTSIAFNTNAFLGELYSSVVAAHPAVEFGYVPVGEVLLRLDDELRQSPVAGLASAWDLYGDSLHLNSVGRYVAHATLAAVLTGRPTDNLAFATSLVGSIDASFIALANHVIDETMTADIRVRPLAVPEPRLVFSAILCATTASITGMFKLRRSPI